MIKPQLNLDLNAELIVDNFAGGGGASCGIELALGRAVDISVNHDPEAVAMHQANHPQTTHHCESVFDVDPVESTGGRPVGLAWFSPDCKHFSKAKGGKPRSKKIRGLAWVVLNWVNKVRPRVIMLENVEEFQTWGPLNEGGSLHGHRKGWYFDCFVGALRRRGYAVEFKSLRACDYGAPTIRKRLFMIARCDGASIVWPEPTHGDPKLKETKAKRLKPWRTAAECIDWSLPCPSIFERKKELAEATQRRIAKGIMRYVVETKKPFIVKVNHTTPKSGTVGFRGQSLDDPLQTVTGKLGSALVAPALTECANASTERVFDPAAPLRTQCAQTKGGHFALVNAFLTKFRTGATGSAMDEPVHTITAGSYVKRAAGAGHALGIVTSHLCKLRGSNVGSDVREPLHTVSAQGTHHAEVRALLIKYYGNEKEGVDPKGPLHTVTARDRFGLVTVNGEQYAISDIGLRMLQPRELYRAQGFPEDYVIGDDDRFGLKLTKTAQVRMCGNSVCPPLAAALVSANVADLSLYDEEAVAV